MSNPNGPNDPWLDQVLRDPAPRARPALLCPGSAYNERAKGGNCAVWRRNTGWRTVIVVTFRPHISRARFILEHCFDGDLVMVASPAHISAAESGRSSTSTRPRVTCGRRCNPGC